MDMGQLVPVGWTEVLPHDTFDHSTSALIRMSPMLAPVMHPIQVRIHHFFVPMRLVWPDFPDFITGENPAAVPPVAGMDGSDRTLIDGYFGVPDTVTGGSLNATLRRAYNLIWNEYYRDQDLQSEVGPDDGSLKRVCWERDYFTTARTSPQKGAAVTIPLTGTAPVLGIGKDTATFVSGPLTLRESDGSSRQYATSSDFESTGADRVFRVEEDPNNPGFPYIRADLSAATAVSIDDLREAFALQRFQEARARYGSRYTEYLRYLGVRNPSDARLQRPEYLGGGKQTLAISEVLQTAESATGAGVGDLKGHGIAALRTNRYRRYFDEHGYVMSLASVRPKTVYMNGIPRQLLRGVDFYETNLGEEIGYFQKEFEHIGHQAVSEAEVWGDANGGIWGYQDKYQEYRRNHSRVCGDFRTNLDHWHLARSTPGPTYLNSNFVECNPEDDRIFAVPSEPGLWCMFNHSLRARRIVSRFGR